MQVSKIAISRGLHNSKNNIMIPKTNFFLKGDIKVSKIDILMQSLFSSEIYSSYISILSIY